MNKRVLLLSAYDALSHRHWRQGLVQQFPEYEWTVLCLPPRYFNWRIRGNALTWSLEQKEKLRAKYDLLISTSMTDLATLRGLVPELCRIPSILYFHENQFAYPDNDSARAGKFVEAKITSIYSALAADQLVFNSQWNKDSFLQGVDEFLALMPDAVPNDVVACLADKCSLLPVPLRDHFFIKDGHTRCNQHLTILWNHRWEYDKAPERFFDALQRVKRQGLEFRLYIVGQQFRASPGVFDAAEKIFREEILSWGFIKNNDEYLKTVQQSDVVVSTALHDFQGLAVLEAVAAGCIPLLPDRLAYPQFITREFLYESYPDDPKKEASVLARRISDLINRHGSAKQAHIVGMEHLGWNRLRSAYGSMLNCYRAEGFRQD